MEERISVRDFLEKEAELQALRKQYGIEKKPNLVEKLIDWLLEHEHKPVKVSRRRYVVLALSCGWFSGAHRFYSGHKFSGILYLMLCWSGLPLALTILDVLLVFLKYAPDEEGRIEL